MYIDKNVMFWIFKNKFKTLKEAGGAQETIQKKQIKLILFY